MLSQAINALCVLVVALAGTGKTTVLVQCVRILAQQLGFSVLALCFATRDKKALEERVKGKAKIFTSNGAGLAILGAYARSHGKRLDVNNNVASQMLETRFREDGLIKPGADGAKDTWEVAGHIYGAILTLSGKVRTCLPLRWGTAKAAPTEADILELSERFNLELSTDDLPTVIFYTQWLFTELSSLKNMLVYGVDCDGMVFLPVYHQLKPKEHYDRVLVDEAQDQSWVNRQIALCHVRPVTGRLIVVGDPNQAIYQWRGADFNSLGQWCAEMRHLGGFETFPLTLCRRCSQSAIRLAQGIVPEIQALPDAPEGSENDIKDMEALVDFFHEKHTSGKATGLVLCRANAPMVSLVLRLLAKRIPAALQRSDIVAGLLRLVDNCAKHKGDTPITDVLEALEVWHADQLAKLAKARNGAAKAQVVSDKVACIRAMAMEATVQTANDLKAKIDEVFPKNKDVSPNDMVVGSTVHGAKGGEAKDVYLLSPDGAKVNIFDQVWSDARDRDNTLYVALTRCEVNLYFCGGRPTMRRFSPAIDLNNLEADSKEEQGDE